MPSPRNLSTRHARARAILRYGVDLSLEEVERQIATGVAVEFERENARISKLFIRAGDQWVPIVFNHARRVIITALPMDAKDVVRGLAKLAVLEVKT